MKAIQIREDITVKMQQSVEYSSFKHFLALAGNSSDNDSTYGFHGADEILEDFRGEFQSFGYTNIILLALYTPTFIIALPGNMLVIITLAVQTVPWRAKHVYLLNLAISDLLVTVICMPCTVATIIYRLWMSGLVLCKLASFLQGVAVATGIFTLTAMSIDRYLSIQHPSHAHWSSSPRHAIVLTAVTWISSTVFMSPQLVIRTIDTLKMPDLPPMTFCIERWPRDEDRQIFGWLLLFVVYIIPVVTVAICYANVGKMICSFSLSREDSNTSSGTYIFCRRRAARILILLVILFVGSWLPYNIMSLSIDLGDMGMLVPFLPFALWLGHAHSAINPALYWATNRGFREMVARVSKTFRNPKSICSNNHRRPRRV